MIARRIFAPAGPGDTRRRPFTKIATSLAFATAICTALSACTGTINTQSDERVLATDDRLAAPESDLGVPPPAGSELEKAGTHPGEPTDHDEIVGSLRPDDATPEERIPSIIKRGYLTVGIQQSQNLLSFRDPTSGDLSGFEVDLAHEIAFDIFGDRSKVDFKFVESHQRIDALEESSVDILLSTLSITSQRQQAVQFSTPYLSTKTRLLVNRNSGIDSLDSLNGHTLCLTDNSTGLAHARLYSPETDILKVITWADCLYAMQNNHADAVLVDDVILAGLETQDPYTSIVGEAIDSDVYGVGVPKVLRGEAGSTTREGSQGETSAQARGLVRQVNSTLERIRSDGTWWEMFRRWFGGHLSSAGPPSLEYRKDEVAEGDNDE